jgi:hypothetical protein
MRILGNILTVVGFLWLLHATFYTGLLPRAVLMDNLPKYPANLTYNGGEVHDAIRNAFHEYDEKRPGVVLPAVMMFVGAVFVDFDYRKSRNMRSFKDQSSSN